MNTLILLVTLTPCQILRENMYKAGLDPYQIIHEVAYCISNREKLKVYVIKGEEVKEFRKKEYIRRPESAEAK